MALPDLTDQFFADTYKGVLHSSNIPITNLPPIYDGLGNKSSLKLGSDGNGASISGCLSADCINVGNQGLVDYIFPIGSVFFSADNVSPAIRFSGTTWERIAQGRFIAGVGIGNDGVNSKNITGGNNSGEYNHTLTIDELPSHNHKPKMRWMSGGDDNAGWNGWMGSSFRALADANVYGDDLNPPTLQIENAGGGSSHNNTPPGFGLYIWRRIS